MVSEENELVLKFELVSEGETLDSLQKRIMLSDEGNEEEEGVSAEEIVDKLIAFLEEECEQRGLEVQDKDEVVFKILISCIISREEALDIEAPVKTLEGEEDADYFPLFYFCY